MEKLLARLAHQLDALDEASLMSLWSKYAALVSTFEPTKRWEENALIFSLIQAKRWKNQLFNYNWSRQSRPDHMGAPDGPGLAPFFSLERPRAEQVGCGTPRMGIGERGRKGELKARAARALKAQRR